MGAPTGSRRSYLTRIRTYLRPEHRGERRFVLGIRRYRLRRALDQTRLAIGKLHNADMRGEPADRHRRAPERRVSHTEVFTVSEFRRLWVAQVLSFIVGFVTGAAAVATLDPYRTLGIDACTFGISALILHAVVRPWLTPSREPGGQPTMW
jgi:hypothetical protein